MKLQLVNTDPVNSKDLIIQAGAYGEHTFSTVQVEGNEATIEENSLSIHIAPGSGATLEIQMQRYVNPTSFKFPWHSR